MSLLYISKEKWECDFCGEMEQIAYLDWEPGNIMVCQGCLQGFINEFNKECDGEEEEHTA